MKYQCISLCQASWLWGCMLLGACGAEFFPYPSLWAVILFESVNYLEHYGLERRQLPNGPTRPSNRSIAGILLTIDQHGNDQVATPCRPSCTCRQAISNAPSIRRISSATKRVCDDDCSCVFPATLEVRHAPQTDAIPNPERQVWRHGPQPKYDWTACGCYGSKGGGGGEFSLVRS